MANGTVIVSETLPTLIGMGVVSQTTQTMFGKNGRRRAATRTSRAKSGKGRTFKIYQGKRGGKYIMKKGRRIYI